MQSFDKKIFVLILAIILHFPAIHLFAQTPKINFSKVTDNIYEIIGGKGARSTVFFGETGTLLIDTKGDEQDMRSILDRIGAMSDKPLLFLVNTHSDGDHNDGNLFIPESVTIISHENCRSELFMPRRDGGSTGWEAPERKPFLPEVCYRDSMSLYFGSERVELRHFGVGHTSGDTVVYFPEQKIAVLGDQYFELPTPYIHDYKGGSPSGNIVNLGRMLAELDVITFLSGHTEPVGRKEILFCIGAMKSRFEKMRESVVAGNTFEDIIKGKEGRELTLTTAIYHEVKAGK